VQALIATPGERDSAHVGEVPEASGDGVALRTLEVGVCGTDREIAEGLFGVAPPGAERLVLGHEFLGVVERDGHGFSAGQLVTATVRRSCERCAACGAGSPDACMTGDYRERGITALDGFASERVVEQPEHLVVVPPALGRLGVLAEPTSVCERGIRHAQAIGRRQPWEPSQALVIGAGAIGMLATYLLRLDGYEVWTAARGSSKAALVEASGARFVATADTPLPDLRDETGGFDLVVEAAGHAELMLGALGLLRRGGVACLLGLDASEHPISIDGTVVGVDTILENRVLFGSVNAHQRDWRAAVAHLEALRERWPDALEQMVGLRVAPDRFEDAFGFRGVKATLRFS
jgi:threonine dehydrogenase-like Zn-dependent dehydrogenase